MARRRDTDWQAEPTGGGKWGLTVTAVAWFRHACTAICAVAGVIFILMDSNILARSATRWALSEWDKGSYAIIAFSIPWLIAILPFFIYLAWKTGHRLWAVAGSLLYLVFLAYNLVGAGGAIAMIRSDTVSARKFDVSRDKDRAGDRKNLEKQRAAIPEDTRPPAQVEGLIAAEKAKPLWKHSDGCKTPSNGRERRYCEGYARLTAELGAGQALERISGKIEALDSKTEVAGWVAQIVDPQAETIAFYTGMSEHDVQRMLPLANPIALQLGSMILLGLALIFSGLNHKAIAFGQRTPAPALAEAAGERHPASTPAAISSRQAELAEWFFAECARPVSRGGIEEKKWYAHYCEVCARSKDIPLPIEAFRSIAKKKGAIPTVIDGEFFYERILPHLPASAA